MIKRLSFRQARIEHDIIGDYAMAADLLKVTDIMFKAIMHLSFSDPKRAADLYAEYQAIGGENGITNSINS